MEKSIVRYEKSIEFVRGGLIELCNALETLEEIQSELMETQEVRVAAVQICYKSDKPCDYDCAGLCKESY
ncbi:hypothetical protein Q4E40_02725 [Pontibacter sp. BT731]|uniref:hypothetical protein n=1 Tax=Pontibacter coccineus TaxID=3063328 RepID=UPI0026E286CA|nr:hypothetical protein [Pontibacter sp. BT731]MDO6389027.1 hypothetical protein [Pontibacter sp. BT731]